jgi:chemotaxis protein methyltransferase CheR/type IV pilus assembly protein PilK
MSNASDTTPGATTPAPAAGAVRDEPDRVAPQVWCELIQRHCGLTFRNPRLPVVLETVRAQMQLHGITSERAYYQRLSNPAESAADWDVLVERLTNNETSFFRHPPSFEALRRQILPELRDARPRGGRLNFWSAGCSTGQEAYSLAMLAKDDAVLQGAFSVWGGDISQPAIELARKARYGHRAAATVPLDLRTRFLRPIGDEPAQEYEIVEELRQHVRFMATNLLEASGFRLNYDLIFCHNVLIYFSPAAVTQAVSLLASCLKPGGYLMLGPGEAPHERPPGLEPVSVNGVRAFQRRTALKPAEVRE